MSLDRSVENRYNVSVNEATLEDATEKMLCIATRFFDQPREALAWTYSAYLHPEGLDYYGSPPYTSVDFGVWAK